MPTARRAFALSAPGVPGGRPPSSPDLSSADELAKCGSRRRCSRYRELLLARHLLSFSATPRVGQPLASSLAEAACGDEPRPALVAVRSGDEPAHGSHVLAFLARVPLDCVLQMQWVYH